MAFASPVASVEVVEAKAVGLAAVHAGRYSKFLEVLADRRHGENKAYREWVGRGWDPEGFRPEKIGCGLRVSDEQVAAELGACTRTAGFTGRL